MLVKGFTMRAAIVGLFAVLLLAGCGAQATPRPVPASPTPPPTATAVPAMLPDAEDMAGWVFTPAELEYIDYTSNTMWSYIPRSIEYFESVMADYRRDSAMLTHNGWRSNMVSAGSGLGETSYFFRADAPSERLEPIAVHVRKMQEMLREAERYTVQALENNDGAALDKAEGMLEELQEASDALQELFTALLG
jgi:hypothetical protein